jgi:hypothetical protein
LEQGIPYLTQFILGKRNVTGHRLWEELGPWRLTWGQTGSVEKKLGFMFGQVAVANPDGSVAEELEGCSLSVSSGAYNKKTAAREAQPVVKYFLQAKLEDLPFENAILGPLKKYKGTLVVPTVAQRDRFTNYKLLDDLLQCVSPIMAIWGCGDAKQADSFASVMKECRLCLEEGDKMTAAQRDQLIHKAPCGMRHFVNEALMSASERLRVLLYTEDPSLEVEKTFLMKGIQHFKFNLKIQKAAVKEKLRVVLFSRMRMLRWNSSRVTWQP